MPDWTHEIRARLTSLRLSPTREREIVEELSQHLDDRWHEFVAQGAAPDEATQYALSEFRGADVLAKYLAPLRQAHAPTSLTPGAPGRRLLADLWHDLRHGMRALYKSPTFTLVAAGSLALSIGAGTAVYSLISALFLAPPAGVDHPEALVRVSGLKNGRPKDHVFSLTDYAYYRAHATVFAELASDDNLKPVTDTERADDLLAAVVSPTYFHTLGVQPDAGRFFSPDERAAVEHELVVVLSHSFWQRRFGADWHAIGGPLILGGKPYSILGVTSARFDGSSAGWRPDIFIPDWAAFTDADFSNPKSGELDVIGRLKPGQTITSAQAEMSVLSLQLGRASPNVSRSAEPLVSRLRGLDTEARSSESRLPTLLVIIVVCLLAIACANVAGLLLARHGGRRKEVAIQLALGASRGRVVRQLLAESLLLSSLGGATGLLVAWWGEILLERAYARDLFDGTRHFYPLRLDGSAIALTTLTAVVTGIVFGLVPALQASRPAVVPTLKEDASAPRRSRLRAGLLVGQVALSTVLLVGAALAVQSTRTVAHNPGVDTEHVAYFRIAPGRAGYRGDQATRYTGELRRHLESSGLVESVSFSWVPPTFWLSTASVALPGEVASRPEDALKVPVNWVSDGFFETLNIPMLRGRGVRAGDISPVRRVVVINEALAARLDVLQDPIGRTLLVDGAPFEIIGLAHYDGLRPAGDVTLPYLFGSDPGSRPQGSVIVRVRGDAVAAIPTLRGEIRAVNGAVPISQAASLTSVIISGQTEVPIAMGVLSFAGGLAFLLTTLGLYGIVALSVGQRTREIGIRVALGARSAGIVRLVLRDGVRLIAIGLPLGLVTALASVRLLSAYLYGISTTDAVTFGAIAFLLAFVALVACYIPARRALDVDPVQSLRCT
jgi:predicted permease